MKNTPQLIGVSALLTFAVLVMPTQQMFAHLYLVTDVSPTSSASDNHSWKTILITEIMADPLPPQGLPEVEYVELFNRTAVPVSLEGWKLSDATSDVALNAITLEPGQYVAVASKPIVVATSIMIVSGLPSLNNTGDSLMLTDASNNVIDVVNYTDDWYRDEQRSKGGWSLELIDVNNTCELAGNWTVTEDPMGGTPGKENSVMASNPDVTGPLVVSVDIVDDQNLRITFNERLSSGALQFPNWAITPSVEFSKLTFFDSSRMAVALVLDEPLVGGQLYTLSMERVYDCAGNALQSGVKNTFALPEAASAGDVLINEILFNPRPDGVDFVELFNASGKYISLNGWAIGSIGSDGNAEGAVINDIVTLHPGQYIAFTPDASVLKAQYLCADTSVFQLKLPSYPDDKGTVYISDEVDSVMDLFEYSAAMHNAFINDAEGVSLERIATATPANDGSNWTSASSSAGFATPGFTNSAQSHERSTDKAVTVTPPVFTPMTGQPNFAEISYRFEQPGCIATVNIYDSRGMIVRHIANNVLLSAEGSLRWDGDSDNGSKALSGYYLVWFQVFADDGSSRLFREPVAISSRY